ncbi:MAG: FMN-binding negative transcriptional regulator [Pyrinomonadaceae bacterium]
MPNYTVESRLNKLYSLIDEYSFGTLISRREDGELDIAHLPFILDRQSGPKGTLLGHVARANPIWRSFDGTRQAVIIVNGPHGYISPSWYTSRAEVPTWNYTVVHAYGIPRVLDDNELTLQLNSMAEKYEQGNPDSWGLGEVPADLFAELKAEIVGFAVEVSRIEGKFKLSQNRSLQDRYGAVAGVLRRDKPYDPQLARLMKEAIEPGDE